jgi:hypothetical protein
MVWCSCASSQACCCAVRSMRLFQFPGPTADARASLLLHRIPFSFLSIGSRVTVLAVGVTTVLISIAISITIAVGGLGVPSRTSPVPMSPFALTLVVTSVTQSLSRVALAVAFSLVVVLRAASAKPFHESTQLHGSLCRTLFRWSIGARSLVPGSIQS